MPARRPTAQDWATARQIVLDGLMRDVDVVEILTQLAPLHPRQRTTGHGDGRGTPAGIAQSSLLADDADRQITMGSGVGGGPRRVRAW